MKINPTIKSRYIENFTIFLDDIVEIYSLLNKTGNKVILDINNYSLDSVEEINQIKDKDIKSLKFGIDVPKPRIEIEVSASQALIYTYGELDLSQQYLVDKIEKILCDRVNPLTNFIDNKLIPWVTFPSWVLFWLFWLILLFKLYPYHPIQLFLVYTLLIFALVTLFTALFTKLRSKKIKIVLDYEKNQPSFLKRNRDEIIIAVIFLIIGTIVGKLI